MYVCMYVGMYVCIYMYVCMYVCMCVWIFFLFFFFYSFIYAIIFIQGGPLSNKLEMEVDAHENNIYRKLVLVSCTLSNNVSLLSACFDNFAHPLIIQSIK